MKGLGIAALVCLGLFVGWRWVGFSVDAESLRLGIAGLEVDSYSDNSEGTVAGIATRITEAAAKDGFTVHTLEVSRDNAFQDTLRFVKGRDGKPVVDFVHNYDVTLVISRPLLLGIPRRIAHSIQFRRLCRGDHRGENTGGAEHWP